MVKAVRIYIEGGGDDRQGKRKLREGFRIFLREIAELCRARRIGFDVITCGGRTAAYDDFCAALRIHRDAVCVLLVDAEGPVASEGRSWDHLRVRDGWKRPDGVTHSQCHLMVQVMESWFLADIDALVAWYGKDFQGSALPTPSDVEKIEKPRIDEALKHATRRTQKGEYHKIRHASELLQRIEPVRVRAKARHCNHLFESLKALVTAG